MKKYNWESFHEYPYKQSLEDYFELMHECKVKGINPEMPIDEVMAIAKHNFGERTKCELSYLIESYIAVLEIRVHPEHYKVRDESERPKVDRVWIEPEDCNNN